MLRGMTAQQTTQERSVAEGPVQIDCRGCTTTLTAKDRFCPVCGHPNPESERHPRFGPVAKQTEAFTTPRPPGPGEVACPRCERPAPEQDTYCSGCGMDLQDAVLRARRDPTVGVWHTYGPNGIRPYRPLRGRAVVLRVALWAAALLSAGALVLVGLRFAANEQGEALGADRPLLADLGDASMWVLAVSGLLAGALLVAFVVRAARNLPTLAVEDARYRPATALWCWFVPVVNLVLPYAVVEDVWRASGPDGLPITRSRRPDRPPLAVVLWWPCLVLGALLLTVAGYAMPASPGVQLDTWRVVLVLGGIGALVLTVGFLSAAVTVGELADRQARRADALGPPSWLRRNDAEEAEVEEAVPAAMRNADDGLWGRY